MVYPDCLFASLGDSSLQQRMSGGTTVSALKSKKKKSSSDLGGRTVNSSAVISIGPLLETYRNVKTAQSQIYDLRLVS